MCFPVRLLLRRIIVRPRLVSASAPMIDTAPIALDAATCAAKCRRDAAVLGGAQDRTRAPMVSAAGVFVRGRAQLWKADRSFLKSQSCSEQRAVCRAVRVPPALRRLAVRHLYTSGTPLNLRSPCCSSSNYHPWPGRVCPSSAPRRLSITAPEHCQRRFAATRI